MNTAMDVRISKPSEFLKMLLFSFSQEVLLTADLKALKFRVRKVPWLSKEKPLK